MTLLLDRVPHPVPEVHDDATRREFIVGGVATGLLVVAGCGSADDQTDAAPPPTTEGNGAFPVTSTTSTAARRSRRAEASRHGWPDRPGPRPGPEDHARRDHRVVWRLPLGGLAVGRRQAGGDQA